nr:hypothetical protein [Nitrospirota bacterium]
MPYTTRHKEALVLGLLDRAGSPTIEQLAAELPELTWSELFHIIDLLSRSGAIVLRRKGFTYELQTHLPETIPTQ